MRTIGMLGGLSRESSQAYDRLANTLVRERLGDAQSARVLLDPVDFPEVEELQRTGRRHAAGEMLAARAAALEVAGTELLLIGPEDSPVPVFPTARIHIEDAVEQAMR